MASEALPFKRPLWVAPRAKRQPFLDGLKHIDYGHLSLIDPEGNTLEFSGPREGPSAFLKLHDWKVLDDLVARGDIGFAEAYVAGRWDSLDLPKLLTFGLMNSPSLEHFFHGKPWYALWLYACYTL